MSEFITLGTEGRSHIEIKQSKFIGHCRRIESAEDAAAFIREEREMYPDARHCCYAWVTGKEPRLQKTSDDGEPSGTAGMPLLSLLDKNGLSYTAVCVTRYFGGILLGKGGLVRAYTEAGLEALKNGRPTAIEIGRRYSAVMSYGDYDGFVRKAESSGWIVEDVLFEGDVKTNVLVPSGKEEDLSVYCLSISRGKAAPEFLGEAEMPGKEVSLFD